MQTLLRAALFLALASVAQAQPLPLSGYPTVAPAGTDLVPLLRPCTYGSTVGCQPTGYMNVKGPVSGLASPGGVLSGVTLNLSGNAAIGGTLGVMGQSNLGNVVASGYGVFGNGGNSFNFAPGATGTSPAYVTMGGAGPVGIVPPIGGLIFANPSYTYTSASPTAPLIFTNLTAVGSAPNGSQLFTKTGCNDGVDYMTHGGGSAAGNCLWVINNLGTGWSGGRIALNAMVNVLSAPSVTTPNFIMGLGASATSGYNLGGTIGQSAGYLISHNDQTTFNSGATYYTMAEIWEGGLTMSSGSSTTYANGGKISVTGCAQATVSCSGLVITGQDSSLKVGIMFGGQENPYFGISATGTLIGAAPFVSSPEALTAAYGVDFSGVTFSTAAFKSNGFSVNPTGTIYGASISITDSTFRAQGDYIALAGTTGAIGLYVHAPTGGAELYVDGSPGTAVNVYPLTTNAGLTLHANGTGSVSFTGLPTTCTGHPTNSVAAVGGVLMLCP